MDKLPEVTMDKLPEEVDYEVAQRNRATTQARVEKYEADLRRIGEEYKQARVENEENIAIEAAAKVTLEHARRV